MKLKLSFNVNESTYLRDPEKSDLGKEIVKKSIDLIHKIGYEQFTFKKLMIEVGTTEASIYRYFENKHKILLYIINWYWNFISYKIVFGIQNKTNQVDKLNTIVEIICHQDNQKFDCNYDINLLNQIAIQESNKSYLIKDVDKKNESEVYLSFKELCNIIAEVILENKPDYIYAHSLSTTILETALQQNFFIHHLPRLTDIKLNQNENYIQDFIKNILSACLNIKFTENN
ncbi:MAG: TetR/AcrR family transcriptional regulator [Bacteroidetes bacterium]|nr:TetR/AcrR family transcriptional regulator [Bacteroidota bacterium]MBP7256209.1 TetR/AcrR family transcriptional regulator [Chitinophagales bacterium]MBK7139412.1 TetR/AcrR family transcriptional regulator [Bacteroidota bacterium]MBK7640196.1 TetR/AcrR family transcriptional regulator [Bacteroidota bacterium]MBK9353039.1 TetR/AcrR family transcriptional regulator [Bacteroidota bacterium]